MQNKLLPVLIAATALVCGARAQDAGAAPSTSPSTTIQQPAAAPAPQMSQAAPAPNQVIYAPRLPSPSELTSAAAAQGLSVEQISQSASQVTVVYRYSNGQTNTVAYQLLPTGNSAGTVVVPSPAPNVVYETSPRVVYYDSYYPYYPRYYYPPVSLSLGFGYYHGWGGGHWGGHRWR